MSNKRNNESIGFEFQQGYKRYSCRSFQINTLTANNIHNYREIKKDFHNLFVTRRKILANEKFI